MNDPALLTALAVLGPLVLAGTVAWQLWKKPGTKSASPKARAVTAPAPDQFKDPVLAGKIEEQLARHLRFTRFPSSMLRNLNLLAVHLSTKRPLKPATVQVLDRILQLKPAEPNAERAVALAAEIVGRFRCRAATKRLIGLLHSESDLVRLHAIKALGALRAREAVDWLQYISTHDLLPTIRVAATDSFHRISA